MQSGTAEEVLREAHHAVHVRVRLIRFHSRELGIV